MKEEALNLKKEREKCNGKVWREERQEINVRITS